MNQVDLPLPGPFNLSRSLAAAEVLADRARQSTAADLRRLLLKSSCDLLDHALRCSEPTRTATRMISTPPGHR